IPALAGKHIAELQPDVIFPHDPRCQNALSLALNAVDDNDRISDTLLMKGFTIFASPQKIPALAGKHIAELQPDVIFPHDPRCQNALSLAL
ncbi:hypothetical protein CKQ90_31955, partial [Klebsiella pneumoniae]